MRTITKDLQLTIDGSPQGFRLTKPDAFSGVEILRLLLRLQDQWDGTYTLDDLLDAAELVRARRENEVRAMEARA